MYFISFIYDFYFKEVIRFIKLKERTLIQKCLEPWILGMLLKVFYTDHSWVMKII